MRTVLHIPHSSRYIPATFRWRYVISNEELEQEILRMTDLYTDELFLCQECPVVVFPYSRLVVDVERFFDDQQEPMYEKGMGWSYSKTSQGDPLTVDLDPRTRDSLSSLYWTHHTTLTELVHGDVIVLDCHSFPSRPLPCDLDQSPSRPDICLGTDSFHTPQELTRLSQEYFRAYDLSVEIDKPYSGALVPMKAYKKDRRVYAIMLEVNRALYMNEETGEKIENFSQIQEIVRNFIGFLQAYEGKTS